jgi:hypothetical protein
MELYIQETETKGRGVFCDETILEGQVIEIQKCGLKNDAIYR